MIRFAAICLILALQQIAACAAQAERLPWQWFDQIAAEALLGFRRSGDWLAEAINEHIEGETVGQPGNDRPPMNFDPTRHLSYVVADLNGDRHPEVFFLFEWLAVTGNQPGHGIVLQQLGGQWHIICDFRMESRYFVSTPSGRDRMIRNRVVLLDRRSHGWRHFRIHGQRYGWKPAPQGGGIMECVPRGS